MANVYIYVHFDICRLRGFGLEYPVWPLSAEIILVYGVHITVENAALSSSWSSFASFGSCFCDGDIKIIFGEF